MENQFSDQWTRSCNIWSEACCFNFSPLGLFYPPPLFLQKKNKLRVYIYESPCTLSICLSIVPGPYLSYEEILQVPTSHKDKDADNDLRVCHNFDPRYLGRFEVTLSLVNIRSSYFTERLLMTLGCVMFLTKVLYAG